MKNKKIIDQSELIIEGLEKAYVKLIAFKKYKNTPLVVSRNGKAVEISADEAPQTVSYR